MLLVLSRSKGFSLGKVMNELLAEESGTTIITETDLNKRLDNLCLVGYTEKKNDLWFTTDKIKRLKGIFGKV